MYNANLRILEQAVEELQDLADQFVFVGGATVGLYISDPAVPSVRVTIDVDCIVEVTRQSEYHSIEARMRRLGFSPDMDGPTCRHKKGDLTIDVMPTDAKILGHTNLWYTDGIK